MKSKPINFHMTVLVISVMNIDMLVSILVIGGICTFYTAIVSIHIILT